MLPRNTLKRRILQRIYYLQGQVLDEQGNCISASQCPCYYRGTAYTAGQTFPERCVTCECVDADWVCTDDEQCTSECCGLAAIYSFSCYVAYI